MTSLREKIDSLSDDQKFNLEIMIRLSIFLIVFVSMVFGMLLAKWGFFPEFLKEKPQNVQVNQQDR